MKKIVLTYGLIAGAIVGGMMITTMPMFEKGTLNFENGEVVGYTTMVIALSLVFFGVKSYRDNKLAGVITFGTAVKVGLLITLVASLLYALTWEVIYKEDFIQRYNEREVVKMKEEGTTEVSLQEATKEMEKFAEMYKNPIFRFGITLMEILPVGIVISLLSAALLKKKDFLATTNT